MLQRGWICYLCHQLHYPLHCKLSVLRSGSCVYYPPVPMRDAAVGCRRQTLINQTPGSGVHQPDRLYASSKLAHPPGQPWLIHAPPVSGSAHVLVSLPELANFYLRCARAATNCSLLSRLDTQAPPPSRFVVRHHSAHMLLVCPCCAWARRGQRVHGCRRRRRPPLAL